MIHMSIVSEKLPTRQNSSRPSASCHNSIAIAKASQNVHRFQLIKLPFHKWRPLRVHHQRCPTYILMRAVGEQWQRPENRARMAPPDQRFSQWWWS
jgi:hypothetical protein